MIRRHPWWASLMLFGGFILAVSFASMMPQTIHFSYAGKSCVNRFTMFPRLLKSTSLTYELSIEDTVSVGNIQIFGRRVCAEPRVTPAEGIEHARLSIGSIAFPALYFRIDTPQKPSVALEAMKQPIAAMRALSLPISESDKTFTYILSSGDLKVECESVDHSIQCDTVSLQLNQGTSQLLQLKRQFREKDIETLFDGTVEVLPAVSLKDSSVKEGQVLYAKDLSFSLTLDKPIVKATIDLTRKDGDKTIKHEVKTIINGAEAVVTPVEPLPRSASYELTLREVEAADGSALDASRSVPFTVSGGPKVASVSVSPTGIGPNARIVLKLDQPRKLEQGINDILKVQGLAATVTATQDTIIVQLSNAGKCTSFSILLSKEILSQYDIKATDDWQFSGRTRCYTVETLGYSTEGRPINAYIYGNGSSTYLYTAAIHGNERSSLYVAQGWMNDLEANPGRIPSNARIIVVPQVNPDGLAKSSRLNTRGVNLNRNFPTANWSSNIVTSSGEQAGGGGESAGSERETQVLMAATRRYSPRFVITLHSSGSLVNSNDVGISIAAGKEYARLARYSFVPNSATSGTFGFDMTGTYEDWLLERGTPAILIELDTDTGNHYVRNQGAMWAMMTY